METPSEIKEEENGCIMFRHTVGMSNGMIVSVFDSPRAVNAPEQMII